MESKYHNNRPWHPAETYKLIASIKNIKKRNLLRGYSARPRVTGNDAKTIRNGNTAYDSMIIGALLKGRHGLLDGVRDNKKKTSTDLFTMSNFPPVDWRNEVCYTAGYINSTCESAIEMLSAIESLAQLENMESEHAIKTLLNLSQKHGASNFLSYKLAYLRTSRELPAKLLADVSKIEDEICHRENAGLHFSALENLSSKISLFLVAQRKISGLAGMIDGNFRKSLSLSNFIPTPLDEDDVAGYLLRASESCLLDTVHATLVIFNLSHEFKSVKREFEQRLNPDFLLKLTELIRYTSSVADGEIITDYYRSLGEDSDTLDLYRTSAAFLERPKFAIYRNKFDRVISARLLAEIINNQVNEPEKTLDVKHLLLAPDKTPLDENFPIKLDAFYRTFLFLRLIRNRASLLSLTSDEIKFIFENTTGLETLLTEDEMRTIYVTAPPETKSLVTVLALALFRKKSVDPDIDFEFRTDFISHVNSAHHGSILEFIDDLLNDSPQIASYIVGSLDEVTLEKMYTLVTNASQASQIRCDILRALGQKLNRIEYFIEADAITTRSKVSKLQQYFDSSRMYVDSISMKKWLDSNPTVSTEQYRALYPRIEATLSSIENDSGGETLIIHLNDQSEYLISQIAKDAFEQFCLNTEFGIESYLGRRIRHNTLDGVTTDTVDAVLRKPEYQVVLANPATRRTVESWMATYKSIVDKLRREHLQFKSNGRLFNAALELEDSSTKENIRVLTNTLRATGGSELLNDLIIAFCWKQITPQLESAAHFIKTTLLLEANASIDKYFSSYNSAPELQIKAELHEAVNEVFKKVADWFQVPQTGFISASVRDLCQIILIDLNRENLVEFVGDDLDIKYTGISVHRLYDCLAVLLQNAHKHGEDNTLIIISVCAHRADADSVLNFVSVDITSTVAEQDYNESKQRIFKAIASAEAGSDMVTEGYTGIKKVKFISRVSEGFHTVRCQENDVKRELKLGFSIHAETATEEVASGATQ
ncbi:hypothetical protein KW846_27975 [Pseudomonas sp. PDM32]|uniref:hypothetical protein n=1 Tax=Pseudomonas sp. PDM32 TaxID=2854768 RepID=UPI001C44D22D|nr:hypothetical protein [Pseudomonas sp. PDM32]MBV7576563.1 hypothetical protein [Pseudomonas sp. PDM32]